MKINYENVPPFLGAMLRFLEDDVTPENIEQHIADYRAKQADFFSPSDLACLKPFQERFENQMRVLASWDSNRTLQ